MKVDLKPKKNTRRKPSYKTRSLTRLLNISLLLSLLTNLFKKLRNIDCSRATAFVSATGYCLRRTAGQAGKMRPTVILPVLLVLFILLTAMFNSFMVTEAGITPPAKFPASNNARSLTAPMVAQPARPVWPEIRIVKDVVGKGETASEILEDCLSPAQVHELAGKCRDVFPLTKLRAGQPYKLCLVDGKLSTFEYEADRDEKLIIEAVDDDFRVGLTPIHYQVKTVVVEADIQNSLYLAVRDVGEGPALAVMLADIFAWDVDFNCDIRSGDRLKAVVEKRYRKGKFAGYGRILAARFVNDGTVHEGFLFEDKQDRPDYYAADGTALRRAFLKAPLAFTRISSGYSMRRFHPILRVYRPHQGIDYAAPSGTPVRTIGDGVVIRTGWDNGGGNYVKIRHNSIYETTYMHLRSFAKGVRKGARVKQGQTIGYVGATGLATGPHLDFRMKKNGSYVNPLKIKTPPTDPVSKQNMPEFRQSIQPLIAMLDGEIKTAELK